jgi:hypothetical protein
MPRVWPSSSPCISCARSAPRPHAPTPPRAGCHARSCGVPWSTSRRIWTKRPAWWTWHSSWIAAATTSSRCSSSPPGSRPLSTSWTAAFTLRQRYSSTRSARLPRLPYAGVLRRPVTSRTTSINARGPRRRPTAKRTAPTAPPAPRWAWVPAGGCADGQRSTRSAAPRGTSAGPNYPQFQDSPRQCATARV